MTKLMSYRHPPDPNIRILATLIYNYAAIPTVGDCGTCKSFG